MKHLPNCITLSRIILSITLLMIHTFSPMFFVVYKNFTGVDNAVIIDNLSFLSNINKDVILRCPIIKGCNDRREHFEGIAEIANRYKNILNIKKKTYH